VKRRARNATIPWWSQSVLITVRMCKEAQEWGEFEGSNDTQVCPRN